MSMPFLDQNFTFTQPDGSRLQVRGSGNQQAATFETLEGFTVIRDPVSQFFHYASPGPGGTLKSAGVRASITVPGLPELLGLNTGLRATPRAGGEVPGHVMTGLANTGSRWRTRRTERREAMRMSALSKGILPAPPQRKTVGNFVGLTLLIDFSDHPATIPQAEVEAFCNQPGYSGFGNHGSVRDYFLDISDGKLDYQNIVAPYYRATQPRAYYADRNIPQPQRTVELIREALDHLLASGFDATALTADSKGFVYALNVYYAGECDNNWAEGLWPHAYYLDPAYPLADGRIAHDYQISDMTDALSLGTFCHENGHMICDFPDLYDYGYESYGAGIFCLMCLGGSGSRAKNPAQVGAYLKHAAGWSSSTTTVQPGDSITLQAGHNEFALHRKSPTEYFIIENRQSAGRDLTLGANGLAVWHVDESGSNNNEIGSPGSHYECALVQADGLRQLERNASPGDDNDLFKGGYKDTLSDTTTPTSDWWDRSKSGLAISGVSAAGPSMTFKVV